MPNEPQDPTPNDHIWDPARPEGLDADEVLAFREQDMLRRAPVREADRRMREGSDLGLGEPLRAAESELPRGPVEPEDYQERPYWALAVLLIGVVSLIATIIGNMALFPVFSLAPEPMQHGWPWVLSTLGGILGGLVMGFSVWPRDHYGMPWWPAIVATLTGLLVASGIFAGLWILFAFFV